MALKQYTVMGFYNGSEQLFAHHVDAEDPQAAFMALAIDHEDAVFVAAIEGKLQDGEKLFMAGSVLLDAANIK